MKNKKKIFFYIGNILIGIITYYAYLYLWVLLSWGEQFLLISLETLISLLTGAVFFLAFNYFLLRKDPKSKKYWWIGLGVVLLSVTIIVSIIELS
ncbi:hypothetical protein [Virgibacillus sp. DJP39]|uniref:hypothetical protein n=1 Tax=Virgibacillus sp. DJP39 TaxID=3409790 RepID=UPI003BB49F70